MEKYCKIAEKNKIQKKFVHLQRKLLLNKYCKFMKYKYKIEYELNGWIEDYYITEFDTTNLEKEEIRNFIIDHIKIKNNIKRSDNFKILLITPLI